jgi:chitinase
MLSRPVRAFDFGFLRGFAAFAGLLGAVACGPLGGVEDTEGMAGAGGGPAASAGAAANGGGSPTLPDPPAFKVVGYAPSWVGSFAGLQIGKLNYLCYAFSKENPDGSVQAPPNPALLTNLVNSSHAAGVRVLLSIGGWNDGDDSAFHALAATPESRARFATALDGYVDQFQLDGIDIDWEFPEADQAANFTAMIKEVSAKLRPKNKLLTVAVAAFAGGGGGVTTESIPYLDLVNIMAYDGQDGAGHSPMDFAERALDLWLGKGVPPEKAILGVPFYSRPGYIPYSKLLADNPQASTLDQIGNEHYNGIPTVQAKTALAKQRAGGIMAWDLSQDTPNADLSLLSAIYAKSR